MRRRTIVMLIGIPVMLLVGTPIAFFAFWIAASAGTDAGSPELAREWADDLNRYATQVEAAAADPTIEIIEFENGEWLFGRAQNSHGIWIRGGGTVVVKDSNGDVRALLGGHVCGYNYLGWGFGTQDDLDSYYSELTRCGFVEHELGDKKTAE